LPDDHREGVPRTGALVSRVEALLRAEPGTFFSFGDWSRTGATGVRLARVKKALFRELLAQAFGNVAPRKLLAQRLAGGARRATE
jgi:hypothetical protein